MEMVRSNNIIVLILTVMVSILAIMFTIQSVSASEPVYKLATDEDFSGTSNGDFRYIGTDEYVEIPHVIKGVPVTSYQRMFENTNVKGVKSTNPNVTDMRYMFYDSQSDILDVSQLDTSNVINMAGMFGSFFWISETTKIIGLENFNTSKVTDMRSMFSDSQVTTLDLSSFDTSKVTNMSNMFSGSQATELDVSSFDTSSVTNMISMFFGSQATELDLSSFDTSSVTNMRSMFYGSQATELDLSSFDTSSVTDMKDMFHGSQATKGYARTQADADRLNASDGRPASLTFRVKSEDGYVLAVDEDFSGSSNGAFSYIGTDEYVEIPHVIKGVPVTSYQNMFENTNVKGVKSTNPNVTDMYGMFVGSKATTLDLSNFDTSSVTDMRGMFFLSQATELDVSSFDTSNVTNMRDMFSFSQATTLDLSSFDTSNVTNMSYMFLGSQATELNLSSFDTSSVTDMRSMFSNSQATELDLSSFDMSNVTNTDNMFLDAKTTKGYARTQEDADKLNASIGKPEDLNFEVTDLANGENISLNIIGDLLESRFNLGGNVEYDLSKGGSLEGSYDGTLQVIDNRGNGLGWSTTVSVTPFVLQGVEDPTNRGGDTIDLELTGLEVYLTLDNLEGIKGQGLIGVNVLETGSTLIDSDSRTILTADVGRGMGAYGIGTEVTLGVNELLTVVSKETGAGSQLSKGDSLGLIAGEYEAVVTITTGSGN